MLIYRPRVNFDNIVDQLLDDMHIDGDIFPEVPNCTPEDMVEALDRFLEDINYKNECCLLSQEEMDELLLEIEDMIKVLSDGMKQS
ncbi:hypothetical protein BVTX09c5_012 [Bovine papular stomatitis virus]|uniref:Uncharacterized protein n=1 Tax=Bovine papular stomatitis virus TaxID=129727 RepID=A0A0E3XAY9_9POXV|nr:hypothetical protein BVTX09c15_012 [Bovine papular stomatitis virus]AKC03310.1 hypothetical protein BVTX09c5_012 [Bovine papular stomatitis virus]AKC03438.1 hypothetical protein BVTX09c1_012 [Bovine papular stomatitis virus]